eukprot:scaffold133638_cov19-Tisochrysis_lutea.AAC.2
MQSAEKQAALDKDLLCFINTSVPQLRPPNWLVTTNIFQLKLQRDPALGVCLDSSSEGKIDS